MSTDKHITNAQLQWNEQGQPLSKQYDDVYFSRESGIAESRYVFLANNHLNARWRKLSDTTPGHFSIAETGFGTGLNFLTAAQHWLEVAPRNWRLNFISVEKSPLNLADLKKALALWPQLSEHSSELLASYPSLLPGFHHLTLFNGRINLTLLFGEAADMLSQLKSCRHPLFNRTANPVVDAWFLDGFTPSKNPDMWSEELFQIISDLSAANTTFATFTAAGAVRRGLQAAGFNVEKVTGFGRKRDMSRGIMLKAPSATASAKDFIASPHSSRNAAPWQVNNSPLARQQSAVIIGGGIAGCSAARALAKRGWQVTIVERHAKLAAEASGNPQGITYPKLSKMNSPLSRYGLHSLMFCSRYYAELWDRRSGFGERCGVLVMPESAAHAAELKVIAEHFKDYPEIVSLQRNAMLEELTGIELDSDTALFHPQLGWLDSGMTCRELANHPNICHRQADADKLALDTADNAHLWHVLDKSGDTIISSTTVIVASSLNVNKFAQTRHLPLKSIRGQVTAIEASRTSLPLKTVICGVGYVAPANQGRHTIGSTFNINDPDPHVRDSDNLINLQKIAKTDAGLGRVITLQTPIIRGRTGFRCTTPDYLPVVGPAPHVEAMRDTFVLMRKNANANIPKTGRYYSGLYISCGYGSRGLSYAPLASELLATQLCGETAPIEQELVTALSPARFIIRNIKRDK